MIRIRVLKALCYVALKTFYKQIAIEGTENILKGEGTLIIANHSNGFIDALVILCVCPNPVVITAKATLRKNPILRFLFWLSRAETVHRSSDADSPTARNENTAILERLSERVSRGETVCLFPEGISHSDPSLRSFKTGAARIFCDASESNPSVRLVPALLLYEEKFRFRSDIIVRFLGAIRSDSLPEALEHAKPLSLYLEGLMTEALPTFETLDDLKLSSWLAAGFASKVHSSSVVGELTNETTTYFDYYRRTSRTLRILKKDADNIRYVEAISKVRRVQNILSASGLAFEELFISTSPFQAAVFMIRESEVLFFALIEAIPSLLLNSLPICAVAVIMKRSKDADHIATNALFLGVPVFVVWYSLTLVLAILVIGCKGVVLLAPIFAFSTALSPLIFDRFSRTRGRMHTFLTIIRNRDKCEIVRNEIIELQAYLLHLESTL